MLFLEAFVFHLVSWFWSLKVHTTCLHVHTYDQLVDIIMWCFRMDPAAGPARERWKAAGRAVKPERSLFWHISLQKRHSFGGEDCLPKLQGQKPW